MSGFTDEERRADAARRVTEQAQRDDKFRHAQTCRPAPEDPFCMICSVQSPSHHTGTLNTPICQSCF